MENKKLVYKVDKGTMGPYNYIGFRKWTGENSAICKDIECGFLMVDPGEYMELGFKNKPDINNWKNEISNQEFEHDHFGDVLGSGSIDDIELLLRTHSNFKQLN